MLSGALLVNIIFNRHEYASRENYFPSLVYFLFCASDLSNFYLNPLILANFFALLGIRRLLAVYRLSSPTFMMFDSGVFLALAVLIFPPFIILLPLLWVGLFRLRSFDLREWLLPMAGFLTPLAYAVAGYWWFGTLPDLLKFFEFEGGLLHAPEAGAIGYLFYVAVALLTLLGLGQFIADMGISTVHRKNSKAVFMWYAVFSLLVFIYCLGLSVNERRLYLLLAPSVAIFMGIFFSGSRRVNLLKACMYAWLFIAAWQIWQHSGT